MTREEFSNGFDVLLNSYSTSIMSSPAPQDIILDEYEKSVFLTMAQEQEVLSLYNGKNISGESLEATEELRRYLSSLTKEDELEPIVTTNGKPLGVSSTSKFFTLPPDLWFITYESVTVSDGKCGEASSMNVFPVRQDEYNNIKKNPFRGANDRRALRLDLADSVVEIVCKYTVTKYYIRYLKELTPIVLQDFTADGLSVNGTSTATDCELPKYLHQRILEAAVLLALRTKGINVSENK